MPHNSIRLMGRPQARLGSEVLLFLQDKRYLLLSYLAFCGDWVSREHLACLFWLDSDSTSARKNLRHLLSRVRALEWQPGLETQQEYLRWQVDTDVAAFTRACAQSNWAAAVQTFGGELLQGFSADDTPEFAAWLETEREHLTQRWRGAVFQQSVALEQSGQTGQGLELLQTLLESNPLDEEALERYMQMAAHLGETRIALRAYERFSELLHKELNLPPTLGLERLAESIRQKSQTLAGPPPPPPIPHAPMAHTPFVGRDLELAEIAEALQQPDCRLLTLSGPGGVGKSRMALQMVLEQAVHFPEGAHFVTLDSLETPEQIPLRIAETLRLPLQGPDPPLAQLERHIGQRAMLLVLDNYEHLLEGAGLALRLLEACPRLHLLVTSRERLNLHSEGVIQVRGLALPEGPVSLLEAQRYDAVRLFVLRAQQVRPDFALNPQNLPLVLEVCRRVEGFPLALELAAAWVRTLPLEEIVQEVGSPELMVSQSRDTQPRHRSMEAVFEHSWRLLTPAEQTALQRLSVFFGGFRAEAVKQVSSTPLPVLAALVDKSLLRLTPTGRYDRHALLYQYMQQRLAEHPLEEQETRSKHSLYYLRYLSRALKEIRGPEPKPTLLALEEELGNLRLSWSWALEMGRFQAIKDAAEALMRFLDARGRYQEGIEMFEEARQALGSSRPQQPAALGCVLVFLGKFQQRLRQQEEAAQTTQQGLDLLRSHLVPDPEPQIWGLGTLRAVANAQGQNQAALAHGLLALKMAREMASPRLVAVCSGWVAISEDVLGQHGQAIGHYREAIFLFKQQGNRIGALHNTSSLGKLLIDLGRFEEALPLLQEALQECQTSGELMVWGETLMYLGRCYLMLGRLEPAWECAQGALQLATQHPAQYDEVWLYNLLGQVASARGQPAEALRFFRMALGQAWQAQQVPALLQVLCGWATTLEAESLEAAKALRLVAEHPQAFAADRARAQALLHGASEGESPTLEQVVGHFLEHSS
jgi:predicted ATPase